MDLRKVKIRCFLNATFLRVSLQITFFVFDRATMPTEVLQWQHPSHLDKCFHGLD